ncbi:MAG: hypothetical protein ACXWID_13800 [Pyrinomonadaceae bacterium]
MVRKLAKQIRFYQGRGGGGTIMIRPMSLKVAAVLLLAVAMPAGVLRAGVPASNEPPKAASVQIILVKAPGIDDEGSRWEISYEFRIANEITLWQSRKDFKAGSQKRVGELIKEGAIKESLRPAAKRRIVFQIPFSAEIQARLKDQPTQRVNFTGGQMSPDDIKRLKEQELRSQVFLFYPIISIYDAKLKKNFIIPAPRSWDFEAYPDARFTIKIEINNDGSYKVDSSLPTKKRSG